MAKFKVGDVVTWYEDLVPHKGAIVRRVLGGDVEITWRGKTLVVEDNDLAANAARNAKFKVGDRVKYVGRKYGAPYGKILTVVKEPDRIGRYIVRWDSDHKGFMAVGSEGFATEAELTSANSLRSRNAVDGRYKPGARVAVELRTRPIIGKVMEFGGRPVVEYSPTTRTRFTGTLIKQNGDKWDIKSDSGEIYKDVKEADFGLSYNTRSRNAVVQKAMNATARNADFKVGDVVGLKIMDGGRRDYVIYEVLPDSYRLCYADDFGVGCERVKKWPSDEFVDKHRRIKVPTNADTSVLHETAVNSTRTTNAVVAKALNASHKHLS